MRIGQLMMDEVRCHCSEENCGYEEKVGFGGGIGAGRSSSSSSATSSSWLLGRRCGGGGRHGHGHWFLLLLVLVQYCNNKFLTVRSIRFNDRQTKWRKIILFVWSSSNRRRVAMMAVAAMDH